MSDSGMSEADTTQVVESGDREVASNAVSIRFDDKQMATSYANIASVALSAHEVYLLFGTNKGWAVPGATLDVALAHRIIMTPTVARGLVETLSRVLDTSRR